MRLPRGGNPRSCVDDHRRLGSVVLVEDDPSVGEGLVALLELEGVACEWIMRGDLAVERLQSNPPDLLILDVGLPDISGVEVYRKVAQAYPALPTLFSTGHGDHRLLDEFDPSAPVGFLSKPYEMDLLTRRVRLLMESRRLSSTA
ncbi:MAG: response regulator [Thermoanaerobaculia bacterium]